MLKISIRDKIKNETIREMSGVQDIVLETRRSKMRFAEHIARMKHNRWTSRIIHWYPRKIKRKTRRQVEEADNIGKVVVIPAIYATRKVLIKGRQVTE